MILGYSSEKNGKLAYSIHEVPIYDEHNLAKLEEQQHIVTDSLTQAVQDVIIEWQKKGWKLFNVKEDNKWLYFRKLKKKF